MGCAHLAARNGNGGHAPLFYFNMLQSICSVHILPALSPGYSQDQLHVLYLSNIVYQRSPPPWAANYGPKGQSSTSRPIT